MQSLLTVSLYLLYNYNYNHHHLIKLVSFNNSIPIYPFIHVTSSHFQTQFVYYTYLSISISYLSVNEPHPLNRVLWKIMFPIPSAIKYTIPYRIKSYLKILIGETGIYIYTYIHTLKISLRYPYASLLYVYIFSEISYSRMTYNNVSIIKIIYIRYISWMDLFIQEIGRSKDHVFDLIIRRLNPLNS